MAEKQKITKTKKHGIFWRIYRTIAGRRRILIQQNIIKKHIRDFNIRSFVETGTYKGDMINKIKNFCDEIYSIELGKDFYERAKKRFEKDKHINIIYGDSGKVIPKRADMYWLDAHPIKGGVEETDSQDDCPIMNELRRIEDFKIILIDDANLFTGKKYVHIDRIKEYVLNKWQCSFEVKNYIIHIYRSL